MSSWFYDATLRIYLVCVLHHALKNISFVVPTICEHAYEFIMGPTIAVTFILAFLWLLFLAGPFVLI